MDRLKNRFRLVNTLALCLIAYALMFGQGYAAPSTSTSAAAVGTQFVYEGRLGNLSGTYDLYFRLWDAASGGALVGSPNTNQVNDRAVTQGEYQAVLNFGPTAFTGDTRYLEVRYRPGTSTGTFTVYPGRQPILPVAYALSLRPGATVSGNLASPVAAVNGINTGTGAGLHGNSTNGAGVWGKSTSGAGVYGESTSWMGLQGVSSTQSGVFGKSTSGAGVYGESTSWIGVHGVSSTQTGVAGKSTMGAGMTGESRDHFGVYGTSTNSDGVHGVATAASRAGVVGVNNGGSAGYGVYGTSNNVGVWGVGTNNAGVYGTSTNGHGMQGVVNNPNTVGVWAVNNAGGYALSASGNTSQSLASGGFTKAMAFVDPFQGSDRIRQCFNSQLPGAQATSGDCGMTLAYSSKGVYLLNFTYPVANRFISVTPVVRSGVGGDVSAQIRLLPDQPQSFQIEMHYSSVNATGNYAERADAAFFVIVY